MDMAIKYKIKKAEADEKESIIVKTGDVVEFTMRNIDNDIAYLERSQKELEAQMRIEEAKKQNVLDTHPHIADMPEEDRVACYIYQQSYAFTKVGKEKLEEIVKQLEDYAADKAEIEKQTGIK